MAKRSSGTRNESQCADLEGMRYNSSMSRLTDIETAIDGLPSEDKQRLLLFLAARLRGQGGRLPTPRRFSSEQMKAWVAEDEADLRRFRGSNPQ